MRQRKEAGLPRTEWTTDPMLAEGRFLNIFREDDKTTEYIFDEARQFEGGETLYKNKDGYKMWRVIFIGRYVNRIDRLSQLYPVQDDFEAQVRASLNPKDGWLNASAYQLHSSIGRVFNVKGAKDALHYIDTTTAATYKAMLQARSLREASSLINSAFGHGIPFMAYQAAVDWALLTQSPLRSSEIFEGDGASATGRAIGMNVNQITDHINTHWSDKKRELYPFDTEQLMCEFRKYRQRKQYGFTVATGRYRTNFLGTITET